MGDERKRAVAAWGFMGKGGERGIAERAVLYMANGLTVSVVSSPNTAFFHQRRIVKIRSHLSPLLI